MSELALRKGELAANLRRIHQEIEDSAAAAGRSDLPTLIVVTKNFPLSDALLLFELGERNFGENREQEARAKAAEITEATWHYQGQVQRKKIGHIAAWADVVHSIDSLEQAEKFAEMPRQAQLSYLLQIDFDGKNDQRAGISPSKISEFLQQSAVPIAGLMCVAPISSEPLSVFRQLAELAASHAFANSKPMLSMGMSADFRSAITCGATHIRIGSSILGQR